MSKVQALFVDMSGHYPQLLGKENCWGIDRDARLYTGPDPVVCHSPCFSWVNMAAVNYARALRETNRSLVLPAWYEGGTDEGCFESALKSVRKYGGVLEHPAFTHAWEKYGLTKPKGIGWTHPVYEVGPDENGYRNYWVCEVWQSAYGHLARKRTWLLYCGAKPPFELNWSRDPGSHQIGWFDRNKPTLNKREASLSPVAFAEELIRLAEWSRNG